MGMRSNDFKLGTNEDAGRSYRHYIYTLCLAIRMDPPRDSHVNFLSLLLLYRCFCIVFAFESFFLVLIVLSRMAAFRVVLDIVTVSELAGIIIAT